MWKTPYIDWMKALGRRYWQTLSGRRQPLNDVLERLIELEGWDPVALSSSRVAVMGCGALGGNFAHWLVRAAVGTVWLFDYDEIEPSNLPRQPYTRADVGINKAIALRYHLRRLRTDRATRIEALPFHFENAVEAGWGPPPDLLFAGVDNDPSRRSAITYANRHGIPAIITGMDGQAAHGYVFVQQSRPDTPCPACFWPSLVESQAAEACAPVSAGIALAIVGIALAAMESILMDRPRNWDVKTISLPGGIEGSYSVAKRPTCKLCRSGPEERDRQAT